MADSVHREIIRKLVEVLAETAPPCVENLLAASTERHLKCLRSEALVRRIKKLLEHLHVKKALHLYNCGTFSGSFEVLKNVSAIVSKSSLSSSRDAVILRAEIQQRGKYYNCMCFKGFIPVRSV